MVETKVKVVLTMSVPVVDRKDAEQKAIDALINSGALSVTPPYGATILNAEILDESP